MTKLEVAEIIAKIPGGLTPNEFLVALAQNAAKFQRELLVKEFERQHELHRHRHNYFLISAKMIRDSVRRGYGEKVTFL